MKHFFTLLSEIKCEGLIDTVADRPTDVENRDTLRNSGPKIRRGVFKKLAYGVRKVHVEEVNASVAEMTAHRSRHLKRHSPKSTSRHTSTDWQKDYQSKRL